MFIVISIHEGIQRSNPLSVQHVYEDFGQVGLLGPRDKVKLLEGERHRGRQRKYWMDNIKEWTFLPMSELLTTASCRKKKMEEDLC